MNRNDGCGGGSVLFSFILGALVGAGLSALFSPTSGAENRRKLAELKDEIIDKTGSFGETARSSMQDTIKRGKDYIESQKDILSSAIEAGKEAYTREKDAEAADDKA